MGKRVKKLRIMLEDGSFTDYIPLGAEAINIDLENGNNLEQELQIINTRAITYKTLIINSNQWIQNTTTTFYEYHVTDSDIHQGTLVEGRMDLMNQSKMTSGYIESYEGGYTIVTSNQPTENVTVNISIQSIKTDSIKVIGALNISGLEWT